MSTTTSSPKAPRFPLDRLSIDSWAVTAALLFIVLIVAGIFPHVPW